MNPLSSALPLPYMPAHVTDSALFAHMHSFVPSRCRTSKYRRTFMPLSMSLLNDLSDSFELSLCYTLSGRTGSALVWHSEGRTFAAPLSVQQVL